MTLVDVEKDLFLFLELQFIEEVPCFGYSICGNSAKWLGTYSVCEHYHLWCDVHKADAERRLRDARIEAKRFVHKCCGTDNQPLGIIWKRL